MPLPTFPAFGQEPEDKNFSPEPESTFVENQDSWEQEEFDGAEDEYISEEEPLTASHTPVKSGGLPTAPLGGISPKPVVPAPPVTPNDTEKVQNFLNPAEVFSPDDQEDYSEEEYDSEMDALESKYAQYPPQIQASITELIALIEDDNVTEVLLNSPTEFVYKKNGIRYNVPERDIHFDSIETYHSVINDFILSMTDTTDRIQNDAYLVEGQLTWMPDPNEPPVLARVHVIAPPISKFAIVTIAKKARNNLGIDELARRGAMSPAMAEFLKATARARVTTVISGLSGAGKTTLLEAMTHYFHENDRVIVVQDTPELLLPISDTVYLTSKTVRPGRPKEESVPMELLVKETNRMRPDRIIVGEVRGGEMAEFLIAANSGADGSMTTIHASSPRTTLDKMLSLALKAETASRNESSVNREIASTVQIIVQAALIDNKHIITHIEEVSSIVSRDTGVISTQRIFEYDRNSGRHIPRGQPTDGLKEYMHQRGTDVNLDWFKR